jgi:hypothetical protein
MNVRNLVGVLVSIAALASAACSATSSGLELQRDEYQEHAAVVSHTNHAGDKDDLVMCECGLANQPSRMCGDSEDECPATHGMAGHDTSPAAGSPEGEATAPHH